MLIMDIYLLGDKRAGSTCVSKEGKLSTHAHILHTRTRALSDRHRCHSDELGVSKVNSTERKQRSNLF